MDVDEVVSEFTPVKFIAKESLKAALLGTQLEYLTFLGMGIRAVSKGYNHLREKLEFDICAITCPECFTPPQ